MRQNKKVKDILNSLYWIGFFTFFVLSFSGFKFQIIFLFLLIPGLLVNSILNGLKNNKLTPTRKNIIREIKMQSISFVIAGLVLGLVIYLIKK